MLVINSIEKSRLQADSFSYSGSGVAWKARFVLFLGFALLAGGLAGSVVCFLLISFVASHHYVFLKVLAANQCNSDGHGAQVSRQGLSHPNIILRNC